MAVASRRGSVIGSGFSVDSAATENHDREKRDWKSDLK
jgi:hypothetical protein